MYRFLKEVLFIFIELIIQLIGFIVIALTVPNQLIGFALAVVMMMIGTLIYFVHVRQVLYSYLTDGRNFFWDARDFDRGFIELVRFFRKADETRIKASELPSLVWWKSQNVPLAKLGDRLLERPLKDGTNLLFIGTPKSGKTANMKAIIQQFQGSILAIDTKGDIINDLKGKRKMLVFDPTNPSNSIHFNPLQYLPENADEKRDIINQIAETLIPSDPKDTYFVPGAQDFLKGIIYYAIAQNPKTSLAKIIKAILKTNSAYWIDKVQDGSSEEAFNLISAYDGTNERNTQGCYQKLRTCIESLNRESLDLIFETSDNMLTCESLENGYDIFIRIPQSKVPQYKNLITLVYSSLILGFMERPEGAEKQIMVMLDEIGQYPPIYMLANAIATLRSKSVCFLISCQSLSQLRKIYGDNDAETLLDCISYTSIFNVSDVATRKYFSDALGSHLVLRKATGYTTNDNGSISGNTSEVREPIMQPEEFGQLANQNKVVVLCNGRYIIADKVQFHEQPSLRGRA